MRSLVTAILLGLTFPLFAQNLQDSLLQLLNGETNDSIKINLLLQLGTKSSGGNRINYLKQMIDLDAKYEHRYSGYRPFRESVTILINENKLDSIPYYIDKATFYAEKYNDSIGLAQTYSSASMYYRFIGDYPNTLSNSKNAREIYKSLKDSFNYFRVLNVEAYTHFRHGSVEEAEALFREVLNTAKQPRDSWVIGASSLGLGTLVKGRSNYEESLDLYLNAYNIWKELKDIKYLCKALNNIGIIYKSLSMYSLATDTYQEIIEANPPGDPYALPLAYANLATIYSHNKEFDKAHQSIDIAIDKVDSIGCAYHRVVFYSIKSDIFIDEGKYAEAKPLIEQTLELAKERKFSNQYAIVLTQYAQTLFKLDRMDEALAYSKEALENAGQLSKKQDLFLNNYLIGKILVEQNQPAKAAPYLLESLVLNDSIKKEEDKYSITEAALNYEIGKKEAINVALKKEAELNKTILDKTQAIVKLQRYYILIIALSLISVLIFLSIIIRNNKVREKLNKKLRESNQQIHEKNKKLQELINIKSKIFSIISHDLRSPMIALYNSIILLKEADLEPEMKDELFRSVEIQTDTTIELLENLLRWSKTHSDGIQVKLQKVDICAAVEQNTNLIRIPSHNKKIQVTTNCEQGIEAWADADLLNMVIRNLLSNAIKFTPRQGEIKIVGVLKESQVVISVSDTGCGIHEKNIKKILSTDEFVATKGTEDEPGSGLGLKLCYNYVNYMKGEFIIESTPGEGSNFIVKIPAFINP